MSVARGDKGGNSGSPKGPGAQSASAQRDAEQTQGDELLASDAEIEAVTKDLEQAWSLIEEGKLDEAGELASKLAKEYPELPEGLVLQAMLAGLDGEPEQALALYEEAMELDDEYVDPILGAAELYLWELDDPEKGRDLCRRAKDIAEEEQDFLDALLLEAEAEISMGNDKAALAVLRELPSVDLPELGYHIRAGKLFAQLAQWKPAEDHFQRALTGDKDNSEALYGLGLCADGRGDHGARNTYFLRVSEIDAKEPRPSWALNEKAFHALCVEALDALPEVLREKLASVPILHRACPTKEMIEQGNDPRILGLFVGVPFGQHSSVGGAPHLETIFIFQRNLERVVLSADELSHEVSITLAHEAGHFFGLSEETLAEMGLE